MGESTELQNSPTAEDQAKVLEDLNRVLQSLIGLRKEDHHLHQLLGKAASATESAQCTETSTPCDPGCDFKGGNLECPKGALPIFLALSSDRPCGQVTSPPANREPATH